MEIRGATTRVQTLSRAGLSQVPSDFIQQPHKRPVSASSSPTTNSGGDKRDIPVVDLLGFDPERSSKVRAEIGRACRDWGAFHVINHDVRLQLLDDVRKAGLSFFQDCPVSDKLRYACDSTSPATEGYGTRMLAKDDVLDWRDYFDHHTFPLSRRDPSRWPHFPVQYRRVISDYADQMKGLAQRLLALISQSLGLESSSCLEDTVGEMYQNITISYYPPCPQPELTLGLQAHSDMGAVTLLIQDDVGGLQVLKDGVWVTVQPLSGAILVILADQTEILTNGEYKSAQHRAITNASKPRLSVATFHDPAKTKKISPLLELLSESSPPLYREVVYGDYVSSWYTKGPEGKRNVDALLL